MNRVTITKIRAALVAALVVGSCVGGYLYWWYLQPKAFTTVAGVVHLDAPLVDATISVYDLVGMKVFEQREATHTTGAFVVEVPWYRGGWGGYVPNDFTIVATGGSVAGDSFTGAIVRTVHNHQADQYYHVNAVTTLIAAYLERHPALSYGDAAAAVSAFLGVPQFIGMDQVVDSAVYYSGIFDHAFFMLQAEEHADFDAFIEMLVDDLELGGQRVFTAAGGSDLGIGGLLGMVGEGIFGTLMFKVTESAMGVIMRQLGYQDMGAKIDEMSQKLDAVLSAVQRIETEIGLIKDELTVIEQAIEQVQVLEYETVLLEHMETIDANFNRLCQYSRQETVDTSDLEKLRDSILDPNAGVYKAMEVIHAFVKGHEPSLPEPGILDLLTQNVLRHVPSYEAALFSDRSKLEWFLHYMNRNDRTELDAYLQSLYARFLQYYQTLENYFSRYLLSQIKGLNLIVEAYQYHNQTGLARDYLETMFLPRMQAQADIFMACVDALVFNAHPTPLAEFPNMGPLPTDPALYAGVPGILDAVQASMPYLAQIYPRADYLVDKCVKAFSEEGPGVFKARVFLSTLQPSIQRTWDIYGQRTTTTSTVGGEPLLEFSPDPIALNEYRETLAFQRVGDQPPLDGSAPPVDGTIGPTYESLSSELRSVPVHADAPSRWALPKAVIDYGALNTYVNPYIGIRGQLDHTVPYGQDGTIHYLVLDFGSLPAGYYRLLTQQNTPYVNEGTGWVLDLERQHYGFVAAGTPMTGWTEGNYSALVAGHVAPAPDAGIYLGFTHGPKDTATSTVLRPWQYHFDDGYTLSTSGFIHVDDDEAGDPYGSWGGYWRQSDGSGSAGRNPTGDAWLSELYPNRNHGASKTLDVQSAGNNRRSILQFDLTDLSPHIVVESATLSLYYSEKSTHDPAGRTYYCYRLINPIGGWVEGTKTGAVETGSCCWNSPRYDPTYAGGWLWLVPGSAGTTGGCYTTTDGASAVVPTAFGWMRWDVTRQVQYAVSHTGKVAHFLIMDAHESSSTKYWAGFHSREYSTGWGGPGAPDSRLQPILEVTYRVTG